MQDLLKTVGLLFILPALFAFTWQDNAKRKKAIVMLTQKEWLLVGYGCDTNNNGVIDGAEQNTLDCEKDNTCCFNADGTGTWSDNSLSCGTGIAEMDFSWQLDKAGTTLDLNYESKIIVQLNSGQLILCEKQTKSGKVMKSMMVFKH